MKTMSMTMIGRCDARIDALRAEFGGVLAARILEAEAADFLWEARIRDRYLGQHLDEIFDHESMSEDVSRVAILSHLDGAWLAGICLVDGEAAALELLWKRTFDSRDEAEYAFSRAR